MSPKKSGTTQKLHAIQLVALNVLELYIKVNQSLEPADLKLGEQDFSIHTGHSKYNNENHNIAVKMEIVIGEEDGQKSPFILRVTIGGIFEVDETEFPIAHIEDWAKRNAPIILYPYIREQVFALTVRCGYAGLILPLVTVPTIRVESPKKVAKIKTKLEK
jgi:preprotein translocase subunit SecB